MSSATAPVARNGCATVRDEWSLYARVSAAYARVSAAPTSKDELTSSDDTSEHGGAGLALAFNSGGARALLNRAAAVLL
jgi:hypothetical protein